MKLGMMRSVCGGRGEGGKQVQKERVPLLQFLLQHPLQMLVACIFAGAAQNRVWVDNSLLQSGVAQV